MSQSSIVLRLWRTDATEKVDRRLEDVFVNHWPTCFVAKKWKQVTHWKFSKELWEGISTRSFPLWLSIRWIACSERHEVKKGDSLFFRMQTDVHGYDFLCAILWWASWDSHLSLSCLCQAVPSRNYRNSSPSSPALKSFPSTISRMSIDNWRSWQENLFTTNRTRIVWLAGVPQWNLLLQYLPLLNTMAIVFCLITLLNFGNVRLSISRFIS